MTNVWLQITNTACTLAVDDSPLRVKRPEGGFECVELYRISQWRSEGFLEVATDKSGRTSRRCARIVARKRHAVHLGGFRSALRGGRSQTIDGLGRRLL